MVSSTYYFWAWSELIICPETQNGGGWFFVALDHNLNIYRLKRYYALQNVTDLFTAKGLDPKLLIMNAEKGKLPLSMFDNDDFETRAPSQWYNTNSSTAQCFEIVV